MQRRWDVNGEALAIVGGSWFAFWMVVALLVADPEGGAPAWVLLVWLVPVFGPLVIGGLVALVVTYFAWRRTERGYFIRRIDVPLEKDLRDGP
jgi:hypothetical protein